MAPGTAKRDAQQRADRIRTIREGLEELVREGVLVLTPEQRAAVEAHLARELQELASRFDVDVTESQKQLSLGMRIVSALGGLAFCAAVFLFFYRFWGLLATPVQVSILIASPLAGLAAMYFVSRRERTLYFTSLLCVVTIACFVLNLFVAGQLFNITPSPNAFFAWGAFAIVLAYSFGLRLPLAAGLLSLIVFFAGTLLSWTGLWWDSFWERPESVLIAGALTVAASCGLRHGRAHEFAGVYRLVGLLAVFVPLLILWSEGNHSWIPLDRKMVERLYQLFAFIASAATIWAGIRFGLKGTVNLGAAFFTIYLFVKLVDWWWDWMPKYAFFFLVGAIAIGLLLAFRKLRERMA